MTDPAGMITDSIRGSSSAGALVAPEVAPRDDLGRAVVAGERVDRPDRADAEGSARSRDLVEAVVEVERLAGLAGIELDGEVRREQVVGREQPVQDRQDARVLDQLGDDRRLGQERVDPLGVEALEVVPAAQCPAQVRRELRFDAVDLLWGEQTRDDDIALLVQVLQVRVDRGTRRGSHEIRIYPE
jgi:hypothetical protein